MATILLTGMSGSGKSTVLGVLAQLGHQVVDTDYDGWCRWVPDPDGAQWGWDEQRMDRLLTAETASVRFVSGCQANQGKFSDRFSAIVLLTAPQEVLMDRVLSRTANAYGKGAEERAQILHDIAVVEAQLRATATDVIDTTAPVEEVVARLLTIASR